jgi:adenosylcobinamide kinase / adenosylcobinamide-phosphate guanylyltransferase
MFPPLTLVLGGASSGKSDAAEKLIFLSDLPRVYIATAQAFDDEMRAKIADHKIARGPDWRTIEAPLDVVAALDHAGDHEIVLLDCATLWLTNQILADRDIRTESAALLAALTRCAAPVVVVSNEVGQGIVPENALARRFRAEQGRLNRLLAAQADRVAGVMAGLPFVLKGEFPEDIF